MFRFSCKILASTVTTHINNNVLNILLGHYFSTADAGNFNQAYQWNFKCYSLIQNMVGQVAQPVLVGLRDDAGRQLAAFRKLMRFTAFVSFPLLFGFGIVAHEFIVIALTEKWEASAVLIQILCVAGAVSPVSALLGNAIVSSGRSGTFFRATLVVGLANIVLMCVLWPWGIHVMVVAYVLLAVAALLRLCRLCLRHRAALLPPPPARARGWRGAIRGFFYPFIFAWHCSQFDME